MTAILMLSDFHLWFHFYPWFVFWKDGIPLINMHVVFLRGLYDAIFRYFFFLANISHIVYEKWWICEWYNKFYWLMGPARIRGKKIQIKKKDDFSKLSGSYKGWMFSKELLLPRRVMSSAVVLYVAHSVLKGLHSILIPIPEVYRNVPRPLTIPRDHDHVILLALTLHQHYMSLKS